MVVFIPLFLNLYTTILSHAARSIGGNPINTSIASSDTVLYADVIYRDIVLWYWLSFLSPGGPVLSAQIGAQYIITDLATELIILYRVVSRVPNSV